MSTSVPGPAPEQLHGPLLAWFDAHARELPWRASRDPYRVWVSEVLLQQTQVARGRVYFERFLRAFPAVRDLAAAPQEAVLKAWEGCGYYARARNLHRAAQEVARAGFPVDYDGWRALPGVGPYTAAAVSSIAYGEVRAVADGNVRRVLARLSAVRVPSDAWVQARADEVLFRADPGRWNEAVMDLGAMVCVPKKPACGECSLRGVCAAFASGRPQEFPAPKARPAQREVRAVAAVVGDAHGAYLELREGSLLGGLWGVPLVEVGPGGEAEALAGLLGRLGAPRDARPVYLGEVEHVMTHRRVRLRVYAVSAPHLPRVRVAERPLSRLDHKALALAVTGGQLPLLTPED